MKNKKQYILVVDDEITIRDLLRQLLQLNDYEVVTASNGKEALAIYEQEYEQIDLVITDLGLPQLNGRKLGAKIKEINPSARMIIATGYADQEDQADLTEIGFSEVVQKPFDIREIMNVVQRALTK